MNPPLPGVRGESDRLQPPSPAVGAYIYGM